MFQYGVTSATAPGKASLLLVMYSLTLTERVSSKETSLISFDEDCGGELSLTRRLRSPVGAQLSLTLVPVNSVTYESHHFHQVSKSVSLQAPHGINCITCMSQSDDKSLPSQYRWFPKTPGLS